MHGSLKITRRRGGQVLSFVTGLIASVGANANPVGPQVVHGNVSFAAPNPQTLQVTNSPSAIINWQSFDIGKGETTRFVQQNAASAVLNRVTTGNSSEILGNLVSNGRVFLINPAGILIGRDGSIDTAGVLLSALQMSDQNFLDGKLAFTTDPAGAQGVVNHGFIKTAPGGEVILIAPRIENSAVAGNAKSGVIESPNGDLVLAAGSSITIASLDDPDITFEVRAPDNEVVNLGQLLAKGGTASILAGTIRHSGDINADSLSRDAQGRIMLKASRQVELAQGSSVHANGGKSADGGSIEISAQNGRGDGQVDALGDVRANGVNGGDVRITGDNVLLDGQVTALGAQDGGTINVRSTDATIATVNAELVASGDSGTGGRIQLEGGDSAFASATLRATGDKGGSVRVLGDEVALAAARINVSGDSAGGKVRVGGGFRGGENLHAAQKTTVNDTTNIHADALVKGDGGDVVVWADGKTGFSGDIRARGGAQGGDGGRAEISGKKGLGFDGNVSLAAPKGETGTLLMDPKNIRFTSSLLKGVPIRLLDPHPGSGNFFGDRLDFYRTDGTRTFDGTEASTIVVYDALDDFGGADAGAVYVYRVSDGALVSGLHGLTGGAGDNVGSFRLDETIASGVHLLRTPNFSGGKGALTLFDPVNGTSGALSAANSLVGGSIGDDIGNSSVQLVSTNRLMVRSSSFDNGANTNAGAITFGSTTNLRGTVSASNSLVGAAADDFLGSSLGGLGGGRFYAITNNAGAGAVTFIDVASPATGVVSSANSLVGSVSGDQVGSGGVQVLGGGRIAVLSPQFNAGAGAITVAVGASNTRGAVSSSNSLVGSTSGDALGSSLVNMGGGNWFARTDNSGFGAVSFFTGATTPTGVVSSANSLVGAISTDNIGDNIFDLGSGHMWAVHSTSFNGGAGAVTWVNSTTGLTGVVDNTNSLVGTAVGDLGAGAAFDDIGTTSWIIYSDHGTKGAVTFIDPGAATPILPTGVIDQTNSLVGANPGDQVGSFNAQFIDNMYVVRSPLFNSGAGAITFGDRDTGVVGVVSSSNSLVGANAGDQVGINAITNFFTGFGALVSDNGGAGAVTIIDFAAPPTGIVQAANSLVGNASGDALGSGGIEFVSGSTYAVLSPDWATLGGQTQAGAVTLIDVNTGSFFGTSSPAVGAVDATNSLVGQSTGDRVGSDGVQFMYNGTSDSFFGVMSSHWTSGGSLTDAGAITWFTLNNPLTGVVTAANSLVGTSNGDLVGAGNTFNNNLGFSSTGVYQLFDNGNHSIFWSETVNSGGGAIVLLDPLAPTVGGISISNSLFGGTAGDNIGSGGIYSTGTHLIVQSPLFDDVNAVDGGAITIVDLSSPIVGFVDASNSLLGDTGNDRIGLANPDFLGFGDQLLLRNTTWHNGTGAVTFIDLASGHLANDTDFVGTVSSSNSLVGTAAGDLIGGSLRFLDNGNVLIRSASWNSSAGAITYLDTTTGLYGGTGGVLGGVLDQTNSLVGSTAGDQVGSAGTDQFFAGSNSYYAIFSPLVDNPGANAVDAGAVTVVNVNTGVKGFVNDNTLSLLGTNANDRFGLSRSYTTLFNGNVVLRNTQWNNNAGAATFLDLIGGTGLAGDIGAANSVIGSTSGDFVGNTISQLNSNTYAVISRFWNNGGSLANAGAVTWGSTTTGVSGAITAGNSLFGSHAGDQVGSGSVINLTGNLWYVRSPSWDGSKSALSFFNITGTLPKGAISATNSLLGSTASDSLGSFGIFTVGSGAQTRVVIQSPFWDNGAAIDAGAVTTFLASSPRSGVVGASNSLVGSFSNDRIGANRQTLDNGSMVFYSEEWNGQRGAMTFWNTTSNLTGAVGPTNSLVGAAAGDRLGGFGLSSFGGSHYITFNNFGGKGAWTFIDAAAPPKGVVGAGNSLVGSTAGDLSSSQLRFITGTQYGIFSPGWDNGLAVDAGAITMLDTQTGNFVGTNVAFAGEVSQDNSLVGTFAGDTVGSSSRVFPFRLLFDNQTESFYGALFTPNWNGGRGAITWFTPGEQLVGRINSTNSFVGSFIGDAVGGDGFSSIRIFNSGLPNEFGAIFTPTWNSNRGAVTWLKAGERKVGTISTSNSFVGAAADDFVGDFASTDNEDGFSNGIITLGTGNMMLWVPRYGGGSDFATDAGAITFIDTSQPLPVGIMAAGNSFVGAVGDRLGSGGVDVLAGERVLLRSPEATVDGLVQAGRLDMFDGSLEQDFGNLDTGSILTDELAISIPSVVKFLNAGGTLALQASNDVFIPTGNGFSGITGGSLTLQAGRNIEINGIVKTDGFLRLHANAPVGDPALREDGEGFVNVIASEGQPAYVIAGDLEVEAENVVVQGGSGKGAFAALVGLNTVDINAHGSGTVRLIAGTSTPSEPVLSQDVLSQLLDPSKVSEIETPFAVIFGKSGLKVFAQDAIELQGGGSVGAFAALASFGDLVVESPFINLQVGTADNTDAVFLGLGGSASVTFTSCEGCAELASDPLFDPASQTGTHISGLFDEPATSSILSMLESNKDGANDEEDDDDDDDDEGANAECN